jgi:hypothetical protein
MGTQPNILDLGFNLPELIIESIIRDGLQNIRNDATIIPAIFNQLTRDYNSQKYGTSELTKIQNVVNSKTTAVVYSYHDVDAKSPCFSIMVGNDDESKPRAHLDDEYIPEEEPITDPILLNDLKIVTGITVLAYDPLTGRVSISDASDLSEVYKGMYFFDGSNTQFTILSGINNLPGQKCIFIGSNQTVNTSGACLIQSSLTTTLTEIKGVTADVKLIIGVHTKDALLTKYLYILLKYFILSRKFDLISRGFYLATWNGSDFTRNQEIQGNHIYTRFLTVSGKVDDTWRLDQIDQVDFIEIEPTPIEGQDTESA